VLRLSGWTVIGSDGKVAIKIAFLEGLRDASSAKFPHRCRAALLGRTDAALDANRASPIIINRMCHVNISQQEWIK
jgi:hypothetical protein